MAQESGEIVVSICITSYNMDKYISRAIDSVLMQKVDFPIEIIIADDCSTDNTKNVLLEYKNKFSSVINIIFSDKNNGLIKNFSYALHAAKGKYIALLDCDDFWSDTHKLSKQVNLLECSNYDIVFTNYKEYTDDPKNAVIQMNKNFKLSKNPYIQYLLEGFIHPSTICFKRSLINFNDIDLFVEKNFIVQDFPLFMSIIPKSRICYMAEATLYYWNRKGSISHPTDIRKKIEYFNRFNEIALYFVAKNPIPENIEYLRQFNHKRKCLLASWFSGDFDYVNSFTKNLSAKDFLKFDPKALYIFFASKNKFLYNLLKPWVTRKRKSGK